MNRNLNKYDLKTSSREVITTAINNIYKENIKIIEGENELDILKENNRNIIENKKLDAKIQNDLYNTRAEIERNAENDRAKNKRSLLELESKIELNKIKGEGEVKRMLKEVDIEGKKVDYKHEQEMQKINNSHDKNI